MSVMQANKFNLPLYSKVFSYITILITILSFFGIIYKPNRVYSFYGITSYGVFSLTFFPLVIFLIAKSVIAVGLLLLKEWTVKLAYFEALFEFVLAVVFFFYMLYQLFDYRSESPRTLSIDLLLVFPYFMQIRKLYIQNGLQ